MSDPLVIGNVLTEGYWYSQDGIAFDRYTSRVWLFDVSQPVLPNRFLTLYPLLGVTLEGRNGFHQEETEITLAGARIGQEAVALPEPLRFHVRVGLEWEDINGRRVLTSVNPTFQHDGWKVADVIAWLQARAGQVLSPRD